MIVKGILIWITKKIFENYIVVLAGILGGSAWAMVSTTRTREPVQPPRMERTVPGLLKGIASNRADLESTDAYGEVAVEGPMWDGLRGKPGDLQIDLESGRPNVGPASVIENPLTPIIIKVDPSLQLSVSSAETDCTINGIPTPGAVHREPKRFLVLPTDGWEFGAKEVHFTVRTGQKRRTVKIRFTVAERPLRGEERTRWAGDVRPDADAKLRIPSRRGKWVRTHYQNILFADKDYVILYKVKIGSSWRRGLAMTFGLGPFGATWPDGSPKQARMTMRRMNNGTPTGDSWDIVFREDCLQPLIDHVSSSRQVWVRIVKQRDRLCYDFGALSRENSYVPLTLGCVLDSGTKGLGLTRRDWAAISFGTKGGAIEVTDMLVFELPPESEILAKAS